MQSHNFNPLDIIFSCHVCGETLDSIYSEPDDGKGLRLMLGAENGAVVKLVLTECSHLTCVKHLEGGDSNTFFPCPVWVCLQPSKLISVRSRHSFSSGGPSTARAVPDMQPRR